MLPNVNSSVVLALRIVLKVEDFHVKINIYNLVIQMIGLQSTSSSVFTKLSFSFYKERRASETENFILRILFLFPVLFHLAVWNLRFFCNSSSKFIDWLLLDVILEIKSFLSLFRVFLILSLLWDYALRIFLWVFEKHSKREISRFTQLRENETLKFVDDSLKLRILVINIRRVLSDFLHRPISWPNNTAKIWIK